MKRFLIVVGIAISFLASEFGIAEESREQNENQKRTIPLSEIITTGPQKELQSIDNVVGQAEAYNGFMMRFRNVGDGGSNVFLVDANKLRDALDASSNVLFGSRSADTPAPVDKRNPEQGSHWLIAYLGSAPSNPTWWTVESVSVEKGKVVLNYRKTKPRPATRDVRRYFYWIPLSKLDPGTYELKLIDADNKAVTLMRRVEVTETDEGGKTQ
jgi:hypothetical protein